MVKISIITIQVNFGAKTMEKETQIHLKLKFILSQPFPWIAHLFFCNGFLQGYTLLYSYDVLD